jgi:hypothetical protein
VTFSEQFNNAGWTKTTASIVANAAVSPDGYTNADTLVPDSGSNGKVTQTFSYTAGTSYTISIFAKKESSFNLIDLTVEGNASVSFDLDTNTFSTLALLNSWTLGGTSYDDYGNGWKRVKVTYVAGSTGSFITRLPQVRDTGDGTSGVLFWGAQLEAGAYATSYIPTLGSSVTRLSDVASKTGISSLIGQTQGTLFVDLSEIKDLDFPEITLDDNTNDNRLVLTRSAVNGFWGIFAASAGVGGSSYGTTAGNSGKFALAYSSAGYVLFRNGVQVATRTAALPVSLSAIRLNGRSTSDFFGAKKVAQVAIYTTRLLNDELATLTTI